MSREESFLQALHDNPADEATWLILADWLEEQGDPRGELLRLVCTLIRPGCPERVALERRLQELLRTGVRPCMPTLRNSFGMELVLIPAGSYWQGSPGTESERSPDEGTLRWVTITRPFYMGVEVVSQAEYEAVTDERPSPHWGSVVDRARFPVDTVNGWQAARFCERLSSRPRELDAGRSYRLPTEAEWEFACRAGTTTAYAFGPTLDSTLCNFDGGHPLPGSPVGAYRARWCPLRSFLPNAFGLFQMHGNVWEWCSDWYRMNAYDVTPRFNPTGPATGVERVVRGGGWPSDGRECRSAQRGHMAPTLADDDVGFRVVMECPAPRS
jgi:uncharacterized protein (TIGR02996 family)